jgi:hypothetical protein
MPSLIGNKPNQVPSNGDLGTMAFRDQTQFYDTSRTVGFRNRLINGAMVIDQRNAGASGTAASYTVDRWQFYAGLATKGTWQQNAGSVTPPVGFVNYLGFTSNSAYSVSAGDYFTFVQLIEGYNIADLNWGTANAKTVTLSFQVYSSLTGTFGGSLKGASNTRSYPFTYSIPVANTWTTVSVTVAGCTDGTWLTTNGIGLWACFGLGVGSTYSTTAGSWATGNYLSATGATSVVGTNGATFYITGVQLEVGSSATGFEYRVYGTELANCQRYYLQSGGGAYAPIFGAFGTCVSSTVATMYFPLPVSMRASPTLSYTGTPRLDNGASGFNISAMTGGIVSTNLATGVLAVTSSGLTTSQPVKIDGNAGGSVVSFSSEL